MRLVLALAFLLATASWAEATTYYVGKSGSDSNSCATATSATAGNRKLTVTAGVNCLSAGDTLIIGNGTYDEALGPFESAQIPSGTSDSVRTIVQAENNNLAILQPSVVANCDATGGVIVIQNRSNITMTGLKVDANNLCPNGIMFVTRNVSDVTENITFQDGTVEDGKGTVGGTGLVWAGRWDATPTNNAENIRVLNSTVQRMDVGLIATNFNNHCFYFKPINSYVQGNTVRDCYNGAGFTNHVNVGSAAPGNTVSGNTFMDIAGTAIRTAGDNHKAYNNVIIRAGTAGGGAWSIMVHLGTPSNNEIDNNTIYDSGVGCIILPSASSSTGNKVRNNICAGTNATIQNFLADTVLQTNRCDSGCPFSADPLFTDQDNDDFTLQSGSTMRDAGTTISTITDDFAGTARPQGSAYDVGAYEFSETVGGGGCPSSVGLLARYWLDEAASGTPSTGTILQDTGPAATVDLTLTSGGSGQPDWTSAATGRGLSFGTVDSDGKAEASIDGTKIHTQLHGCKTLTVALVVNVTSVNAGVTASRLIQIGSGTSTLKWTVLSFSATSIRFALTMNSTLYTVDFPHTHASEGRTVLHFVVDTAQATEADRVKMYRDGSGVSASAGTYPAQNATWDLETGQVLTLWNRPDQTQSPEGIVYYAALYDTALSSGDVSTNATALASLDDALPVTLPSPARARHGKGRLR